MTDYIQAQGSAEARRQNIIEQLGRCEVPAEWQPTIRDMLAEIATLKGAMAAQDEREQIAAARLGMVHTCDWPDEVADEVIALKRKVLDNITRHEDVEAQIRRDAGEQVRVLRDVVSALPCKCSGDSECAYECRRCAALASTAPVAEAVKEEGEK